MSGCAPLWHSTTYEYMKGTSSVCSQENLRMISSSGQERFQSRRSPWPPLRNRPQNVENSAHRIYTFGAISLSAAVPNSLVVAATLFAAFDHEPSNAAVAGPM